MLEKDYRHTASKGNSFIDSPPYWIINELYQFESKPNARMIMGSAAEEGAMNAIQKESYDEYGDMIVKLVGEKEITKKFEDWLEENWD